MNLTRLLICFAMVALCFVALLKTADAQTNARSDTPTLPAIPHNYANPPLPRHFNAPPIAGADNEPIDNPVTNAGATLGRVLFYDVKLSANNTIACASCHEQATAFSDSRLRSVGFEGGHTERHSMGLSNARYYSNGAFFWDERATTLEQQVLMPIQDSVEMGTNLDVLVLELAATSYYPDLFEDAFGDSDITSERVSKALAQFVRSIVSYRSKYDVGVQADPPFSNFTAQELAGRELFRTAAGGCGTCHGTNLQITDEASNIGLDLLPADLGVGVVTGDSVDDGKFKIGSLRNVAYTAPYMHDGRFATLTETVRFYSSDIRATANLAPELRRPNGQPRRLNFTDDEVAQLVAFLNTLSDPELLTDERWSDPFAASVPTAVGELSAEITPSHHNPTAITFLLLSSLIALTLHQHTKQHRPR